MKLAYVSIISTSLLISSVFTTSATAEQTRSLNYADSEMQLCGQAIDAQIKRQYGRDASLVVYTDQLLGYFISNGGIEGVRGVGMVKGLANPPQIGFDCVVDTGNKRVQKAKITVLKSNTQNTSNTTSVPFSPSKR